MIIRKAAIEDSEALAHIQVDSYRSAYGGILPDDYLAQFTYEEQTQDWRDLLAMPLGDVVLVAVDNEQVVGYALGRPKGQFGYDCELVAIHIPVTNRRQGVGRKLMATMARYFHEQGHRSLILWTFHQNQNARAVYEHLGGVYVDKKQWQDSDLYEIAYGWQTIQDLF